MQVRVRAGAIARGAVAHLDRHDDVLNLVVKVFVLLQSLERPRVVHIGHVKESLRALVANQHVGDAHEQRRGAIGTGVQHGCAA